MVDIVQRWTETHALPPMGFMVTLELFQHKELRRYWLATPDYALHRLVDTDVVALQHHRHKLARCNFLRERRRHSPRCAGVGQSRLAART